MFGVVLLLCLLCVFLCCCDVLFLLSDVGSCVLVCLCWFVVVFVLLVCLLSVLVNV